MRGSHHTQHIGLIIGLVALAAAGCRTDQTSARQARDIAITAEVKARLASQVRISTLTNIDVLQVQQAAAPPPLDDRRPETKPGD